MFLNQLVWLYLARLSSLVLCMWVRPDPTQVKYLSGAPLLGKLMALLSNIRLGCKIFPGTNALADYDNSWIVDKNVL
jgi:hypothetical protein